MKETITLYIRKEDEKLFKKHKGGLLKDSRKYFYKLLDELREHR